jgi:probable HAF family extracellular repeat protein
MVSLGVLPDATRPIARAYDVSADGSVVVGYSSTTNRSDRAAFVWTEATGMQSLGDLPGGPLSSEAYAVSSDGRVVVGGGRGEPDLGGGRYDNGADAFIWTEKDGMRELSKVLTNEYGLNLHDFRLREATGISADGNIIVGVGAFLSGNFGWRVNLIPEPSAVTILSGLAVLPLFGRRPRSVP